MPTGYRESGALVVAADRDDTEALRRLHEFQLGLGLQVEWLTPGACRRLEPGLSPRIGGGILAHDDYEAFSLRYSREIFSRVSKVPTILFTKGGTPWLAAMSRKVSSSAPAAS